MTRNCLESEGKGPMTSRCYAQLFLSDDSFADFAEDFVKIQGLQVINFDDHGLVSRASSLGKTRC